MLLSRHHLHPPSAIDLDKINEFDLVKIVNHYDDFCHKVCERSCKYQITEKGKLVSDGDKVIAENYNFEIGKEYSIEIFSNKIKEITLEQ